MDIVSEGTTAEASQGLIHHIFDGRVARRLDVTGSDPITLTYLSPYSPGPLYGTQSLQCLAEKCRKFGHEVWLLEIFGNGQRAVID